MAPTLLLLTLALSPADAATPPPEAAVEDASELQGEWEIETYHFGRNNFLRMCLGDGWVFAGTSARLVDSMHGGVFKPFRVRVDPARFPAEIDEEMGDGRRIPGIYRRTGDELIWPVAQTGNARPSSFERTSGVGLWTLRRVKK